MMPRPIFLTLLALAACSNPMNPDPFSDGWQQMRVGFNEAFRDTPLDDGPIKIIANDPDPLRVIRTFTLAPCRDGTQICGGSDAGPVGTSSVIDGQLVVANAYRGLTFYLDPNGDGFLEERGVFKPLAWD